LFVGGEVVVGDVVGRGVFVRVKGSGVMNRDMSRAGFRFESTFSNSFLFFLEVKYPKTVLWTWRSA
jgi:hypothetical protein